MRVNEDYKAWNAERQAGDEESVLAFWKKVLKIRKEHPVLVSSTRLSLREMAYDS
jgi:alpha-glucosidase